MTRIFKYNEHTFQDPGEEYTVEDVKRALAATFPDIAQATTETQTAEDGTEEVTFVKRSGTKGAEAPRVSVQTFAVLMETRLRANEHKGGWEDVDPLWPFERLEEKAAELKAELYADGCDADLVADLAADVGNYAMMIVDLIA